MSHSLGAPTRTRKRHHQSVLEMLFFRNVFNALSSRMQICGGVNMQHAGLFRSARHFAAAFVFL